MINIALVGAGGRMGIEIAKMITAKPDYYNLVAAITNGDDISLLKGADVVIDFSTPDSTMITLNICVQHKIPLVIGTTGFSEHNKNLIGEASKIIPILMSPNMSLSVNMLFKLTEIAAGRLSNFEAEIVEAHHRYKKDAPSGTAIKLGEVVASSRNIDFKQHAKFTRYGIDEQRNPQDIGFAVVRGGDIVGKHDVMFIDNGEILTLTSEINNRSSFANGSLIAGAFLRQQKPGLYNMFDVLDL
jgi:4-hydroxy-tetrahydrodipicolinate reductase